MASRPKNGSPPTSKAPTRSIRTVGLAAAVLVTAVAAFLALHDGAAVQTSQTRIECRSGSLLYVLHLMTLDEQLFDLESDPQARRNLLLARPEDAQRCRSRVIDAMNVESIDDLRDREAPTRESLRSVGYL
jgi:hypothetical protein